MPKVTIGLVTYNRAHLLSKAIETVLQQTFTDFELIISDDNSKDNTADVVGDFALTDSRIKYIKRTGIGMTANFIETLHDSSSEYFMWLCDDDYISENYLETCITFLNTHPKYALACGVTKFCENKRVVERSEFLDLESANGSARVYNYYRHVNSNIILYGLMRRNEIITLCYPDTFGADLLWSSQVVFLGKVKILDTCSFFYSLTGISQQTENLKAYYKTTQRRQLNPYVIFKEEAVKLILSTDSVFGSLGFFAKRKLALKIWSVLRERFCMSKTEAKFRSALKIRTRIKALFR